MGATLRIHFGYKPNYSPLRIEIRKSIAQKSSRELEVMVAHDVEKIKKFGLRA